VTAAGRRDSTLHARAQAEIGERLGVDRSVISTDVGNSQLGKIHTDLGEHWNDKGVAVSGCGVEDAGVTAPYPCASRGASF